MKSEVIETKDTIRELAVDELDQVAGGFGFNISNLAKNLGIGQQNTGISFLNINVGIGSVKVFF